MIDKNIYTPLEKPIPVKDQKWPEGTKPLVATRTLTYNHELYIRDCLDGILMQETTFPIRITIFEDCSTDRTAEIVKEYQAKYPSLIFDFCQKENTYQKNTRPAALQAYFDAGKEAKYIAFCEGDDYWMDPTKLQKQVDYLDAHPDIVITSFDAIIIDQYGNKISDSKLPHYHHRDYTKDELTLGKAWLLTMNWMYRNVDLGYIPERSKVINGDLFLTSILGQYGGSHHHTDIQPSVYRMHQGGTWSALSLQDKAEAELNTYYWMYKYYKRTAKPVYAEYFLNMYKQRFADRFSLFELLQLSSQKLWRMLKAELKGLLGSI